MTSQIRVDEITNRSGLGTVTIYDNGFEFTGVTTFTEDVDITGGLTIGGVLTYEDVTNIDSVGIITARAGLHVTGGNLGVGLNNPDRALSVSDQSNGNLARFIGPTNNLFIMNDRSGVIDLNSSGTGDHLCLGTQNTERLRITSTGSVGIGTDTISDNLEVFAPTNASLQIKGGAAGSDANRSAQLKLLASGSKLYVMEADATDGSFRILDSSTERVRITSGGDLLLGGQTAYTYDDTGASNTILDITNSTNNKRGILSLSGNSNANGPSIGTIWFNNDQNSGTSPGVTMKLAAAIQAKAVTSDGNAGDDSGAYLQFLTKPESAALAESMVIHSDGVIQTFNHAECLAYKTAQSVTGGDASTHELGVDTFNFNRGGFTISSNNLIVPKTGMYRCFMRFESMITNSSYSIRAISCNPRVNGTVSGTYTSHWHSVTAGPTSNTHYSFTNQYYLNLNANDAIDGLMTWYPYATRTQNFDLSISLFYIG